MCCSRCSSTFSHPLFTGFNKRLNQDFDKVTLESGFTGDEKILIGTVENLKFLLTKRLLLDWNAFWARLLFKKEVSPILLKGSYSKNHLTAHYGTTSPPRSCARRPSSPKLKLRRRRRDVEYEQLKKNSFWRPLGNNHTVIVPSTHTYLLRAWTIVYGGREEDWPVNLPDSPPCQGMGLGMRQADSQASLRVFVFSFGAYFF